MNYLAYPAVLLPWDDGKGYTVTFPDLPGVVTEGVNLAEAILMGTGRRQLVGS